MNKIDFYQFWKDFMKSIIFNGITILDLDFHH
jgi:hypothetical protein